MSDSAEPSPERGLLVRLAASLRGHTGDPWRSFEPCRRADLAVRAAPGLAEALAASPLVGEVRAAGRRLEVDFRPTLRAGAPPPRPAALAGPPRVYAVDAGFRGLRCLLVGAAVARLRGWPLATRPGSLAGAELGPLLQAFGLDGSWRAEVSGPCGLEVGPPRKLAGGGVAVGGVSLPGTPLGLLVRCAADAERRVVARDLPARAAVLARNAVCFSLLAVRPHRALELPRLPDNGPIDAEALVGYGQDTAAFVLLQRVRAARLARCLEAGAEAEADAPAAELERALWRFLHVSIPLAARGHDPSLVVTGLRELAAAFRICDARTRLFADAAGRARLRRLSAASDEALARGFALLGLTPMPGL